MFYRIVRFLFKVYLYAFNRVNVEGTENIPPSGGLILCPNHIHWLDPILVGVCVKRKVHYMAKAELFKNKLFSVIMEGINAFPVKRGSPDISAIKKSLRIIKEGEILGIFPEGTRSRNGKLLPAEPGVAVIAIKTNAPVLPIRIKGSYKFNGKLKVIIGKPINFDAYSGKKLSGEEINEISQSIMKEIAALG